MKAADPAQTPQPSPKRWRQRLGLLFLFCIVALIALFAVWRARLSRNIQKTLADIHAAGYPVSLAELEEKYYPLIFENENAATFFLDAFNSLQITNVGKNRLPDLPECQSPKKSAFFSGEKLQAVNGLLAANRAALDQLLQSSVATNCRYPINLSQGFQMLLPHLASIKSSASLLSWKAVLDARNGDTANAIDDLNAIFRLCHSLDREPVLVSQLVWAGRTTLAVLSLEYLLNAQQLSDAQLATLLQSFSNLDPRNRMEQGLTEQLCCVRALFEMSGAQMYQVGGKASTADPDEHPPSAAALNRGHSFIKATGFLDRDYLFFMQIMQQHLQNARLPFPRRLDAETELRERVTSQVSQHYYLISSLFLPSLGRLHSREAGFIARINLAQTALAIERYRLANQNRLPEKLSDLVPAFLPAELMDPFDGKPIRYKKLAKGYMVYSIGEDRKDDGGAYAPQARPGTPADITFVVERGF